MRYHSPPTRERNGATPTPLPNPPPLAPPLETPHTTRQLNAHHRPQPEPHNGAAPPARTVTSEQPDTTTTPNRTLLRAPAHDPASAAARAPSTNITHPPCHEAAPQHVTTHDDPVALDIDSLLELELQHTEDTEQHMDLTPPELEPAASNPANPGPHNAPPQPPPRERAPLTRLSNALRCHHPTHEDSKGPAEYRASPEHDLPDVTGPGLRWYTTTFPSPGAPTQEWKEEYAVNVTDMKAYVESVYDPEQDTILSLLAYHSWRWGHQVTLQRPQDGPHQWSLEQTAKWDIVLQLTPEGFYILTHSRITDTTPTAEALPLAQPQEDDTDPAPPEECNWGPPTATTEHMPHRLTKRYLPHDYHATSDSRGRCTLPLQWASPEGTFTWREILPGAVALTYLWHRDAKTHTQPPGTHLPLTVEGEAAIKDVHTAEGQDYVTANADTAVWLHAHEHTTAPTVVPGSHPWHVVIVRLPTGAGTGSTQQGWADRWAHVCASLHDGLHRPSLISHTLELATTTAESSPGRPPTPGSGPTRAPSTARQRKPSRPPSLTTRASCTPPTITRKRATPYGGTTPHQKGAYNHRQTSLASVQTSQRSPTRSPQWPS